MGQNVVSFYSEMLAKIAGSKELFYKYYETEYSYEQLYSRICQVNGYLKSRQREIVALYTDKCFDAYAGIYAVILSGNTWLPISKDFPPERNVTIFQNANIGILLYDEDLPDPMKAYLDQQGVSYTPLSDITEANASEEFDFKSFDKDDLAYIMFTSGSTGVPKGVPMTHENYISFVDNAVEILPFKEGEIFADFHDFAFDISIFYLFTVLFVNGAISPIIEQKDKIIPVNHILKNGITVWASVPSVINRIMQLYGKKEIETEISIMFLCGEPFKLEVLDYCFNNMKLQNVYNFYGLTETGVENFYHHCELNDLTRFKRFGMVPIGKPLPGNDIAISDEKELLLAGCQITPGYLNGIQKDRFLTIDGKVWYKSGDIVERFEDVYFCKGRLDSQVKISGHRIELLDIEANLIEYIDGITHAVCIVKEVAGRKMIVATVIAEKELTVTEIQKTLQRHIPKYMVPQRIQFVDELPLNANGKVDRRKIAESIKM